jgi:hypothetical protein
MQSPIGTPFSDFRFGEQPSMVDGQCLQPSTQSIVLLHSTPLHTSAGMEKVKSLLASISSTDGRLVSVIDTALEIMEKEGLAWRAKVPCRLVGVHPANRGGYGVNPAEVHRLGSQIVAMGFSKAACSHAVAIENGGGICTKFTEMMQASPMLGTCTAIQYGSVSCSHTNEFLKAVMCGVETDYENLCDADKTMSYNRLCKDGGLKEALDHGLDWLIVSASAVHQFPQLPDYIQSARNLTGAVHQQEDSFQLLNKIQNLASHQYKACGGIVDWSEIEKILVRRCHASVEEVGPLVKFCRQYGGGEAGTFVADLCAFQKDFVPPGRVVPVGTWKSLTDLKLGPKELAPHFMCAVLKSQAACPKAKLDGNICKYISNSDINSLQGQKKDLMLQAEAVLSECRAAVSGKGLPEAAVAKALGKLDVHMVKLVLNKGGPNQCQSPSEIAQTFAEDLGIQQPVQPTPKKQSEASASDFVQYDEAGKATNSGRLALLAAGFKAGCVVKDKGGTIRKITAIDDDGTVQLDTATVEYEHFVDQYKVTNEVQTDYMHDWASRAPCKCTHYRDSVKKGYITTAMAAAAAQINDIDNLGRSLNIAVKPLKAVYAKEDMKKVVLVPESTKIVFAKTSGALRGSLKIGGGVEEHFWVQPMFSTSFASPAWAMKVVDSGDTNMKLTMKKVGIKIADTTVEVHVPTFASVRKIAKGDELVACIEEKSEPAAKRAKAR